MEMLLLRMCLCLGIIMPLVSCFIQGKQHMSLMTVFRVAFKMLSSYNILLFYCHRHDAMIDNKLPQRTDRQIEHTKQLQHRGQLQPNITSDYGEDDLNQ